MEYKLKELTPVEMRCGPALACPAIYEVTPNELQCGIGACPAIYVAKNVSAELVSASQGREEVLSVKLPQGTHYFIIGEKIDPAEFGLEKKVGNNEALIKVPKELIDNRGK